MNVQGTDATSSIGHANWTLDGTPGSGTNGATRQRHRRRQPHAHHQRHRPGRPHLRAAHRHHPDRHRHAGRRHHLSGGLAVHATTVDLYGADAGSGVDHVEWKLDGAPPPAPARTTRASRSPRARTRWPRGSSTSPATPPAGPTTRSRSTSPARRTRRRPRRLEHHLPAVVVTVKGTDTGGAGIQQVQWDVDNGAITGSGPNNSTVTIAADGHHIAQDPRDRRLRHLDALEDPVRPDRHGPADGHDLRHPRLADRPAERHGHGHRRHLRHPARRVRSSTAPRRRPSWSARPPRSRSAATASTPSRRACSTPPATSPGWKPQTDRHRHDGAGQHDHGPAERLDHRLLAGHGQHGRRRQRHRPHERTTSTPTRTRRSRRSRRSASPATASHTLTTTAYDNAGNSSTRTDTIKIDNLAPTDTTVAPGGAVANHFQITVAGNDSDSGIDHVEWHVDNGTPVQGATAQIDGIGPTRCTRRCGTRPATRPACAQIPVTSPRRRHHPAHRHLDDGEPAGTRTPPSLHRRPPRTPHRTSTTSSGGSAAPTAPIQHGASGTTFTITGDGSHHVETRAQDGSGNWSLWRQQTVKIDTRHPRRHERRCPPAGRTPTPSRCRAPTPRPASQYIEYTLDGGTARRCRAAPRSRRSADGTHTISHRAGRQRRAGVRLGGQHGQDRHGPARQHEPAAPTGWQQSIALRSPAPTRRSGFDHGEWRLGTTGGCQTGDASRDHRRHATRSRRARSTRPATPRRRAARRSRSTPRRRSTRPRRPPRPGCRTTFTTTVCGTDAASGVAPRRVAARLDDRDAADDAGGVGLRGGQPHALHAGHRRRRQRLRLARDTFGIDRTPPTLTVSCGTDAWRTTAAGCTVAADGGASGLRAVTVSRNGGPAAAVDPAAGYAVGDDGDWNAHLPRRRRRGQRGRRHRPRADRQDRPGRRPDLRRRRGHRLHLHRAAAPTPRPAWPRSSTRSTAAPPQAPGPGGSFSVAKGHVVVPPPTPPATRQAASG